MILDKLISKFVKIFSSAQKEKRDWFGGSSQIYGNDKSSLHKFWLRNSKKKFLAELPSNYIFVENCALIREGAYSIISPLGWTLI